MVRINKIIIKGLLVGAIVGFVVGLLFNTGYVSGPGPFNYAVLITLILMGMIFIGIPVVILVTIWNKLLGGKYEIK